MKVKEKLQKKEISIPLPIVILLLIVVFFISSYLTYYFSSKEVSAKGRLDLQNYPRIDKYRKIIELIEAMTRKKSLMERVHRIEKRIRNTEPDFDSVASREALDKATKDYEELKGEYNSIMKDIESEIDLETNSDLDQELKARMDEGNSSENPLDSNK